MAIDFSQSNQQVGLATQRQDVQAAAQAAQGAQGAQQPAAQADQNTASRSVPLATEAANSGNFTNVPAVSADNQVSREATQGVDLETAVAEIGELAQSQNRNLNFSVDEGTQRPVVTVTDSDTGDLIRQIPSEEVLQLSERLQELGSDEGSAVGVLFNREV